MSFDINKYYVLYLCSHLRSTEEPRAEVKLLRLPLLFLYLIS